MLLNRFPKERHICVSFFLGAEMRLAGGVHLWPGKEAAGKPKKEEAGVFCSCFPSAMSVGGGGETALVPSPTSAGGGGRLCPEVPLSSLFS